MEGQAGSYIRAGGAGGGGPDHPSPGGGAPPTSTPYNHLISDPVYWSPKNIFFGALCQKKRAKYRGNPFWGPWGRGVRQAHSPYPLWGSNLQKNPWPNCNTQLFWVCLPMWYVVVARSRSQTFHSTALLCLSNPFRGSFSETMQPKMKT